MVGGKSTCRQHQVTHNLLSEKRLRGNISQLKGEQRGLGASTSSPEQSVAIPVLPTPDPRQMESWKLSPQPATQKPPNSPYPETTLQASSKALQTQWHCAKSTLHVGGWQTLSWDHSLVQPTWVPEIPALQYLDCHSWLTENLSRISEPRLTPSPTTYSPKPCRRPVLLDWIPLPLLQYFYSLPQVKAQGNPTGPKGRGP